jgi:hypothetical protein
MRAKSIIAVFAVAGLIFSTGTELFSFKCVRARYKTSSYTYPIVCRLHYLKHSPPPSGQCDAW